jgi:endonuclease YncB( thermonuclease family)
VSRLDTETPPEAPTAAWHPAGVRLLALTCLAAATAVLAACSAQPANLEGADEACSDFVHARVTEVIDGDTFEVELLDGATVPGVEGSTTRVRAIGIDTPEVDHSGGGDHECWGLAAWEAAIDELEGREVWLAFDRECTDTYDRTLAYVYRGDGLFWNLFAIEQGHGRHCPFGAPAHFDDLFASAEDDAFLGEVGLWGDPCWGGNGCFESR